mmetsp:Transcript_32627/g.29501  ORF Transcript_32627/g.29501 Transcript_32627/m.29501 type:complete len:133 (+) Transcript_32627:813-1211(+)
MVILSIMTTIAFSYKDFIETQKTGWLLQEDDGVGNLTKKFLRDVVHDSAVSTLEDLKTLKKPFERLKQGDVSIEEKVMDNTGFGDDDEGDIEEGKKKDSSTTDSKSRKKSKEFESMIYDKINIMPNYGNDKE